MTTNPSGPGRRTVALERDGPLIRITGLPRHLADRLTVPTWESASNDLGVTAVRRPRSLLHRGPGMDGRSEELAGPAGLENVAARLLQWKGLKYSHRTERPAELPAPDMDALADRGPVDLAVLLAM